MGHLPFGWDTAAEPVCVPPGAGKALACASEPYNGALPPPPPPPSRVSEQGCGKGFCCVIPQAVLSAPCLQTGGTQKLRQRSRSQLQRPWAETRAVFPAGSHRGAGSECCSSRAPSSWEGTRDLPPRVKLLLGTYSYRLADTSGEAEQDTPRHKAQLCKL